MTVCVSEPVEGTRVPSATPVSNPLAPASPFYSQMPELQQSATAASPPLVLDHAWSIGQRAIAGSYNRLGDLFHRLAGLVNLPIAAALAVWFVESSGQPLIPGKAVLRFEVHHFWSAWGYRNAGCFDAHFQFGGRDGAAGHPWEGHAYRITAQGEFAPVHVGQASEYAALQLARQLAGDEAAIRCISIGGCQLMGCDFDLQGYPTAKAMYDAFQTSENAHVLGFFDFCTRQAGGLIGYLRNRDFAAFALHYNGPGQVELYAAKLRTATADAEMVLAAR